MLLCQRLQFAPRQRRQIRAGASCGTPSSRYFGQLPHALSSFVLSSTPL
jgi:hypothetical protein